MRKRIVALAMAALFGATLLPANSHAASSRCATEYENHNQIDHGPLVVQEVRGTVSDPHQGAIAKACLIIFTEKNHKSLVTAETDVDGHFSFQGIPPGRYRLVVKADPLCAANIPLRVVSHLKRKQILKVHMEPRGLDTCSYSEAMQARQ